MSKKNLSVLVLGLLAAYVLILSFPASAAPYLQPTNFPTPTPGEDGRILYIVQPGDTWWRIASIVAAGTDRNIYEVIDELKALNPHISGDTLIEGQTILLGYAVPESSPTPVGGESTSLPGAPTPTPAGPNTGNLCVLLYDDVNGDGLRQEEEPGIPEGAISVTNRLGTVSETATTQAGLEEPEVCFFDLEEGDYNVTVAIPEGYNPTTNLNYALTLEAGDDAQLNFGAQISSQAEIDGSGDGGGGRSPILLVAGLLVLLGGLGLGIYSMRMSK